MMYLAIPSTNDPSSPPSVHFYCSSGGNAGLACATTAAALNCPATIVVPDSTSAFMISKLRSLGAEVIQTGASWAEADAYLRETFLSSPAANGVNGHSSSDEISKAAPKKNVYVPPFDHPDIWTGVSTLVDELLTSMPQISRTGVIDGIVCNVGGGGLLNGIMEGLERHDMLSTTKVLAVETEGADSLHASVLAGEHVTLPRITSIATSLGARRVSEKTWEWAVKEGKRSLISAVVTDAEAAEACLRFLDDARLMVEVSCGATIATVYKGGFLRRHLGKGLTDEEWATKNVVVVVCCGSNVSWEILEKYKKTFGI